MEEKREDENFKEITVGRLSLFAAHQRGLRQGLACKDKPTETQNAKSKVSPALFRLLTRGTVNNKEHHLDFPPHFLCFPFPCTQAHK